MADPFSAIAVSVGSSLVSHTLFDTGGQTNMSEAAAQMQQDRADEMFDLWVNYYQPVELTTLAEIAGRQPYIPQFDAVMQRTNAQVLYDAAKKRKQALSCVPMKCEGMRREVVRESTRTQARIIAHAMQSAKMGEDAKQHIKDEQRIHDRMIINNIGMNINTRTDNALAAASSLHHAAASRASAAYAAGSQTVGKLVDRGVNWFSKQPSYQSDVEGATGDFARGDRLGTLGDANVSAIDSVANSYDAPIATPDMSSGMPGADNIGFEFALG